MKFLSSIDEIIAKIELIILMVLLSLMVIISFTQVVLRNIFETGISWADPMLRYTVLWLAFIGASIATRENRHINIDVLTRLLSPKLKKIVSVLTNLFALSVCLILLKSSIDFIKIEMQFPSEIFLGLKNWMLEIIIPIGFSMMSLRFLLNIIKLIFVKNIF
ncbi:TRAP-type C4-dicarboxylate transport system, small permease component [Candidatus Kryptonium thompsonii]|uniref:TRAP-type C4-dicarboxylate transport system, small permease component n=1 Tax=Candidatus Kryptonium thompsonii TaxID=1633631 RepID=A0A0P1LI13_9BACT|nr:TRAP transporter small permease [Candidatus Kryptonium thompsoni]CUS78472.1 TRAP-type C4-dicarboxylate transport system, small permease component [Candidatus Kryptonium thompsoni]CUS81088.1 TRAP-type C4-dicarboxylate transport system, small permease component [Candidatus Kryptonium thompsoni]CUS81185.1 TRAP-type C4-dicarboxylate transport system, small permease component [Candidatus Kryptonium thompsoni]CUS81332.1 TRAP-type C4-dicarboxylate transport system, small permease component [Candida